LNKYPNLLARIATALIGAVVIVFSIVYSYWSFGVVFFIIMVFTLREFLVLLRFSRSLTIWLLICAFISYAIVFGLVVGFVALEMLVFLPILVFISLLWHLYPKEQDVLRNMALSVLAFAYIMLPIGLMPFIGFLTGTYEPFLVVGLLLIIWGTDTGGYFVGITFGRHKLFERISPKKSWEGLIGGSILSMTVMGVYGHYVGILAIWEWVSVALVVSLSGVLGDLVESLIKRETDIKDSGNSLPGHGGFLDRFDSLLFAIPFYLLMLSLFLIG